MRNLRHFPSGSLVEVTTRTVQGRLLLAPSPALNQIILGVLGRAQRLYGVRVHAYSFASNHYHLLLSVDSARQLADFMGHFNSKLGREIGRLTGWKDKIWSRRYQAILVSTEEKVQAARLRYILAHGPKEGLVLRPQDWPGVHCAHPLLEGKSTVEGTWYDRRREYVLRRGGKDAKAEDYSSSESVVLTPIPCWRDLSPEQYRRQIESLVQEIIHEAGQLAAQTGAEPLGAEAVCRQNREERPKRMKKSPAPRFHVLSKQIRQAMYEAYALFVAAFREAADRLRGGDREARFPAGCFPPRLPFVAEEGLPIAA
jgi:REP element-mobilizing transposase RayT